MHILGINGGTLPCYHDAAACIISDGKVVAAVEEERLNRIKHAPGQIPYLAIVEVLKIARLSIKDIDAVASHGSTWGDAYQSVLEAFFNHNLGHCPPIYRMEHHSSHAASTYYASGFQESMILTMDASGDGISLQRAIGKNGEIKILEKNPRANSLGIFYAMITQYCGFVRDSDEYKVMGLAPYGNPDNVDLSDIVKVTNHGYEFNSEYMIKLKSGESQPSTQQPIYSKKLIELLGPSRVPRTSNIEKKYKDIAAAAQQKLTQSIIAIVKDFYEQTGLKKLCLAGGVALNCAANLHLKELPFIDELYVQPASSDAGIALGAGYLVAKQLGDKPQPMNSFYLGSEYSNEEIKSVLDLAGAKYKYIDNPSELAADLVSANKVIGWFQGRMEFGPRALGNRSILGNPLNPKMKAIINDKIKFRESFRPFCPSVLEEDFKTYFKGKFDQSPYMVVNYEVHQPDKLPSSTHVDQTSRVQTVNAKQNKLFYQYLLELKNKNGIGVSINTSFNRSKEPIVAKPIDAISAYFGSGLDALIIGNYVLEKYT